MARDVSDAVQGIVQEIERYLDQHPNAADSADGIHRCWLPAKVRSEPLDLVVEALDILCARGVVRKIVLDGVKPLYAGTRSGEGDEEDR